MLRRMFVDTAAGQIHCRMGGDGTPLILLHQVPMSSATFGEVIPILSPHFRVFAMDLPLYGDSYKMRGEPDIEGFAKATLDFLNALGIDKAHVGGHHTGACVAVELAAEHAARVDKLILSGCPSWTQQEGLEWLGSGRYKPLEITPDGWFLKHIWEFAVQRIPKDRMDKAYECALDYMKAGTRAEEGHRAAFRYDTITKLKKIKQPTLAICGDLDILFPYHASTLRFVPHAQSLVLKSVPSQTPRLFPKEWGEAVLEFLESDGVP